MSQHGDESGHKHGTEHAPYVRDVESIAYHFEDDGVIPNNPHLPLLLYPQALQFDASDPATVCETVFASNQWGRSWRNGIFPYHHFHSNTHEVLAIAAGRVRVQFGGEAGQVVEAQAGDVIVIPAGVGHKNLGAGADLLVVGAYPPGPAWDLCRGEASERSQALQNIRQVALPTSDPVYGSTGPLLSHWLA